MEDLQQGQRTAAASDPARTVMSPEVERASGTSTAAKASTAATADRKAADALRKRKAREQLRDANVRSVRVELPPTLVEKLELLAPLYGYQARVSSTGDWESAKVGGFLGKVVEDMFAGPEQAPSLWKALNLYWIGHPSMIVDVAPFPLARQPEDSTNPTTPVPQPARSPFSFSTPSATPPISPYSGSTSTPCSYHSRGPPFIPPPYTLNQRAQEQQAPQAIVMEEDGEEESDAGVELQEGTQAPEVSFLHVSRAYQLMEFCATHGAHGSVIPSPHTWLGQCLAVRLRCSGCGIEFTWIASEMELLHGAPELNGRGYAACLSDGGTYELLRAFYAGMKMPPLSKWAFYRFQKHRLAQVVFAMRDESFARALQRCGADVRVEVDCQWDTDQDGKNSCTEFLDNQTTLILHAEVVSSKEGIKAQAMETEGSGRGLLHVKETLEGLARDLEEGLREFALANKIC
ncbi:hypothetical protein KFL_011780010 [Klebsormidium nitens]|uniref:Uncharacterized protein n=1 Tax=Klebsormidium nitens TaxID=105231 RepID=A0A1Y1IX80_KLENI|nr:hypothetical protein KFL_011780010 [Klebsormidium nitens]|eukprot:GAQ92878.1 hypothetical protein KFL_011780010 [Klebsormidium nitens]